MKVVLSILMLLALNGCGGFVKSDGNKVVDSYEYPTNVKIWCDKEKGVEYVLYDGYKAGGLTLRRNVDGSVSTCEKMSK